jgi:quinoprotein glucose dehydrogenase
MKGDWVLFDRVILDGIPSGRFHNSGSIAFGPEGMLYMTASETFPARLARDRSSLGGKMLQITLDGNVPSDNSFTGLLVFSFGYRNPQGLAWHPETGDLFASEHGPIGENLLFASDEINVICVGIDYGWPQVIGAPAVKPFIDPLICWNETTPPSGIFFSTKAASSTSATISFLPHWKAWRSSQSRRRRSVTPMGAYHRAVVCKEVP